VHSKLQALVFAVRHGVVAIGQEKPSRFLSWIHLSEV
jgi:hypothetical protein